MTKFHTEDMILTENGKLPAQGYAVYQFGSGPAMQVYHSQSTIQVPIPAVIPQSLVMVSPPHYTLRAISLKASTPSPWSCQYGGLQVR